MKDDIHKEIEAKFDEKVKELKDLFPNEGQESKIVDFGYKVRKNNEFFSVVDWGNIKSFIYSALDKAVQAERERIWNFVESESGKSGRKEILDFISK